MKFLITIILAFVFFGCASNLKPFCISENSSISIVDAQKIIQEYIDSTPGKRENFWLYPVIYKNYYVFPNSFAIFQASALRLGIWINRKTGKIETPLE